MVKFLFKFLDAVSTGAMPFTLSEVAELASVLRDVCLGLVELAYPETRTNASFSFTSKSRLTPSSNADQETRLWMHLFKVSNRHLLLIIYLSTFNLPLLFLVNREFSEATSHP